MAYIAASRVYQMQSVKVDDDADLVSEDYRFAGPVARLMTAEQFVDAVEALANIKRQNPRSYLLGPGSNALGNSLKVLVPPKNPAADRKVEMRASFESKTEGTAVIHLGHSRNGKISLNGTPAGNTGTTLRKKIRKGKNTLVVAFPPKPKRVLEMVGFVDANETLLLDGATNWEVQIDDGAPQKMVPFQTKDRRKKREADARKAAVSKVLLQTRFPELNHARASLRDNDLLMRSLGRPNREQVVSMRQERLTMLQAMDLSNGPQFSRLIKEVAQKYEPEGRSPGDVVDDVFIKALCRRPSEKEKQISIEILSDNSVESKEDFFWSVVLLPEFQIVR